MQKDFISSGKEPFTGSIDAAGRIALVDIVGQPRTINLSLLREGEGVVGDWVLVHVGLALRRVDAADAHTILAMVQACDQRDQEEQP